MKVTQVIKEAITARINAKCEEANKGYVRFSKALQSNKKRKIWSLVKGDKNDSQRVT